MPRSLQEEIDIVSRRVGASAAVGLVGGVINASLRGAPIRATTIQTFISCTIVGTVLFTPQRVAYVALEDYSNVMDEEGRVILSYAASGIFGGGMGGYLFQKRPLRGMAFFTPVMLCVGLAELKWEKVKKNRIEQAQKERLEKATRGQK